ncbi:MAG: glycoside hydrolase family 95 protein, partial [Clostridia bacterium]|nr:glycoside hydrolase family 95 protein [Clostridia bacterium]
MRDILSFDAPAEQFEQATPIGCGRLGAMIYGRPCDEIISLNEDTLWSGYIRDKNRPSKEYLTRVRELMRRGDIVGAEQIVNKYMLGEMSETYLPFGTLHISFGGEEYSSYSRRLNMNDGTVTVEYTSGNNRVCESCFASYPAGLIVIRYDFGQPTDMTVGIDSLIRHTVACRGGRLIISGKAPDTDLPTVRGIEHAPTYSDDSTSVRFCGIVSARSDGTVLSADERMSIKKCRCAVIKISLATSYTDPHDTSGDAYARADSHLTDESYDSLLSAHIADFSRLYGDVSLNIGDKEYDTVSDMICAAVDGEDTASLCTALYNFGRYLMISSSRSGSMPTNLQGIWNDRLHPAWCSNYTLDINLEMNYWAAEAVGLGECCDPLFDFIDKLRENGRRTAEVHYGCRGWVCHSGSDLWAYTTSCGPVNDRRGCSRYAFWMMSPAWLCRQMWQHYVYLGKERGAEFLTKRALPAMAEAARFYLDFLSDNGRGTLTMCPSVSPENIYWLDGETVSFCDGVQMDAQILRDLFTSLLQGIADSGEYTVMADELRSALSRLAPLSIMPDGRLTEFDCDRQEAEPLHRHTSHLYALYPSEQINDSVPELKNACLRTLDARGYETNGWSVVWRTCCYARLGFGDRCARQLRELMHGQNGRGDAGSVYPNLFLA